jgi:hypothetical protein
VAWEDAAVVLTGAAQGTGTVNSNPIRTDGVNLHLVLDATARTGTPTLDVKVQWSQDGGATWAITETAQEGFTQLNNTIGTFVKTFPVKAPLARVQGIVAGTTPTYTYTVRRYVTET